MARVAGVDLPPNKRAQIGLTYIYGVGKSRATAILDEAAISANSKIRDLSEDELNKIRAILDGQGEIEGDLRKRVQMDIKRLMDIGCYRGLRHRRSLPVRGQPGEQVLGGPPLLRKLRIFSSGPGPADFGRR